MCSKVNFTIVNKLVIKKPTCRFHFPLSPLSSAQILILLLDQNKKLQFKKYTFNVLNEMDMG
jgi:hypothetical protein